MQRQLNSKKVEDFVRWFLRFNGYFSIESFIVHDPSRIWHKRVGQSTESDTVAVRMPYSAEQAGSLYVANYPPLVAGADNRFDVVIAEVKSGKETRPNPVWRDSQVSAVEYIVRFVGLRESEAEVRCIAQALSTKYCFEDPKCRFRYIVFSIEPHKSYASKVRYIRLRELVDFLVEVRGQSWIESNIGVASLHQQWNQIINAIFEVANDQQIPVSDRPQRALEHSSN